VPSKAPPSTGELFALEVVCWPFATVVLATMLFALGVPLGPFHLWAGLLTSLAAGRVAAGDWQSWIKAAASLVIATGLAGTVSGWLYDFSGDGQWYHLPGIVALAEGWNPFRVPRLADWDLGFERDVGSAAVYVQHYAKAVWIVAAAAYRATGALEAAKVFNFLWPMAAFFLVRGYLYRVGAARGWANLLALTVALNPVTLYQVPSFFLDGQLAIFCTLLIVLSLDHFREPRWQTALLVAACTVMLVNAKFTGVVYAIALAAALSAAAWWRGRRVEARRYAAGQAAVILSAIFLVGYQPYVTNLLLEGNPFYPAVGRDAASDAATRGQFNVWAPPGFMAKGRVEKLVTSLLAESSGAESMPRFKAPFTVTKDELYIFFNTEPRYGGFGPLFGSVFLATVAAYVLARKRMSAKGSPVNAETWTNGALLALLVAGSALLNPEAWWARLSPQIWLVPPILLASMAIGAKGWLRRLGAILTGLLIANSVLVAALNWGRAAEKSMAFRDQLAHLRSLSSSGPVQVTAHPSFRMITERRLRGNSVPFERAPKPSCGTPFLFSYPTSARAAACAQGR
jgi:hypothetical protein